MTVMPKEQSDFLEKLKNEMLESTNMKPDEAYEFAFRVWQCLDILKKYVQ